MPVSAGSSAAERTERARALLDGLDDESYRVLPVLCGADLCVLGGPKHPLFWEPLATAWRRLDPQVRGKLTTARTRSMIDSALLIPQPPGTDRPPSARLALSAGLGILLAARCRPSFVVTTQHAAGIPTASCFALGDEASPVRGIVQEIPVYPVNEEVTAAWGPLGVVFRYRLCTPAVTARLLARWAMRPAGTMPSQPSPPRVVARFRPGEGTAPTSHQLVIQGDGLKARVDGPGMSGQYDIEGLNNIMADLLRKEPATDEPRHDEPRRL